MKPFALMVKLDRNPMSVSEHPRSRMVPRRFSVHASCAGTLDGVALISNSFSMQCLAELASLAPFPC